MQSGRRPSPKSSLRNAHADIETPSWRKFVPNCDTDETEDSDDDTTAEAYVNKYHELALDERRKWAGTATANPQLAPNGTPRPRAKASSKRIVPIFPTPTETFHIVRRALQAFHDKHKAASYVKSTATQQHQLLQELEATLTCYSEVEAKLNAARTCLKAAVNAQAYSRGAGFHTQSCEKRDLHDLGDILCPFSLNPPVQRGTSGHISSSVYDPSVRLGASAGRPISQPPTPPLPSTSSLLTKDAIAMINKHAFSKVDLIGEVFRRESSALKEDLKRLARQAEISVSEATSFQTIQAAVSGALQLHRASKSEENRFFSHDKPDYMDSFGKMFRREIDAEKYPLLARSFELDPDYCLNGTRMSLENVARDVSNYTAPVCSERKPWDSLNIMGSAVVQETTRRERKPWDSVRLIGLNDAQEQSDSDDGKMFGKEPMEFKKLGSFENDNDLMLPPSTFQASRLDARRKLRQNVKRKLPRIHKERRTRKAFRFRDSAESISSRSSGASSSSPRWNSFREDATEGMGISRKPSVTVQFQQVVDLDDKEDGTEPSVVYLDDEG